MATRKASSAEPRKASARAAARPDRSALWWAGLSERVSAARWGPLTASSEFQIAATITTAAAATITAITISTAIGDARYLRRHSGNVGWLKSVLQPIAGLE